MTLLAVSTVAARAQNAPGASPAVSTNAVAEPGAPITVNPESVLEPSAAASPQNWNWHLQNTDIVQGDPSFPAKYSGPASLNDRGEVQQTVTLDLFAGVRLWRGAEAHVDGLMWQGYGLSQTHGIEAFPNGDAYKAGTGIPNLNVARLFIRQTIGLGGSRGTSRMTPWIWRAKRMFPG